MHGERSLPRWFQLIPIFKFHWASGVCFACPGGMPLVVDTNTGMWIEKRSCIGPPPPSDL